MIFPKRFIVYLLLSMGLFLYGICIGSAPPEDTLIEGKVSRIIDTIHCQYIDSLHIKRAVYENLKIESLSIADPKDKCIKKSAIEIDTIAVGNINVGMIAVDSTEILGSPKNFADSANYNFMGMKMEKMKVTDIFGWLITIALFYPTMAGTLLSLNKADLIYLIKYTFGTRYYDFIVVAKVIGAVVNITIILVYSAILVCMTLLTGICDFTKTVISLSIGIFLALGMGLINNTMNTHLWEKAKQEIEEGLKQQVSNS